MLESVTCEIFVFGHTNFKQEPTNAATQDARDARDAGDAGDAGTLGALGTLGRCRCGTVRHGACNPETEVTGAWWLLGGGCWAVVVGRLLFGGCCWVAAVEIFKHSNKQGEKKAPSGLCQLTFRHKKGAPQTFIPPGRGGRGKSRQNYTFCPSAVPCHFGHPARAHIQRPKCCNSQQCVAWSQHAVTLLTRQPNQLTTNAR